MPSSDALGRTPRKRSNITAAVPPSTAESRGKWETGRGQRSERAAVGAVSRAIIWQFFRGGVGGWRITRSNRGRTVVDGGVHRGEAHAEAHGRPGQVGKRVRRCLSHDLRVLTRRVENVGRGTRSRAKASRGGRNESENVEVEQR